MGATCEGSITQPVPRVLPHDAPLMVVTMGHMGHLTGGGKGCLVSSSVFGLMTEFPVTAANQ